MSGHSKWATTHRQKEATDAKRGAIFTKIANLITIAAKQGGGDVDTNFQLRLAVDKAKIANMPKDNIDRAIKRGLGQNNDQQTLSEVVYEIIGPAGSIFLAEAITDNKNRTVGTLKGILNKCHGQLGSPNSGLWLFDRLGHLEINQDGNDHDEFELSLIEQGIDDITKIDNHWHLYCQPSNLQAVQNFLTSQNITSQSTSIVYRPKNTLIISDPDQQQAITKLYESLNECEEINNIYTNVDW